MDHQRFDQFARSLASGMGRRRLLGALAAAMPAAGLGLRPEGAAAGCKKVGKKCDKNSDCCDGARCGGGKCKCKGSRKECDGKCYKLNNDEKHCGRCNNKCRSDEKCRDGVCEETGGGNGGGGGTGGCDPACGATEECVDGVCTTPPGGCPPGADSCSGNGNVFCGDTPGCTCNQTTEGVTRCADGPIPGVFCGSCQTSADCAEYGADAFCARSTNTDVCCGPDAQNFCRLPCPA